MSILTLIGGSTHWLRHKQFWRTGILVAVFICDLGGPAIAVLSDETGTIEGREPTASGYLTIRMPSGGAALVDNAEVSLLAKPNEFTLGGLTSGLTVSDSDGDTPLSMALTSSGVSWVWRGPSGTPLTPEQFTQPFRTNFANGDILTVEASADVDSTSESGTPNVGTATYASSIYRVKMKTPTPMIYANGELFALNSGFPTTGFSSAVFRFYMNGTNNAHNSNYTYTSSNPEWLWVGPSDGIVTLTRSPTSETKTASITITDNEGYEAPIVYTIAVNNWFINNGLSTTAPYNSAYACTSKGSEYMVPPIDRVSSGAFVRAPQGSLWAEWGRLDMAYYGAGWSASKQYWVGGWDNPRHPAFSIDFGSIGSLLMTGSAPMRLTICMKNI